MAVKHLKNKKEKPKMFKKTMTYKDFNGLEIKEDFYFNFTKAEILEMQLEETGGLSEKLQRIINAQDVPSIIKVFKDLILRAFGQKSQDGKRFIKSEQISNEFSQTNAFADLYIELATNTEAATEFINNVIPAEQLKEIQVKESQEKK